MLRNKITTGRIALVLFFIHPFIAFLVALRHLKSKQALIVLVLFFTLFGFTFIAQNERADSFHYASEFNYYRNSSTYAFMAEVQEYLTFETNRKDLYTLSSYYLVSRFTDNYHVLMALWAMVFSFLFIKSFKFFVVRPEFRTSIYTSLLAFLFIYSNNIYNINGVRFWTAAWLSVYVVFEVVVNNKMKFILLAFIAPLIHISYVVFPLILLVYPFIKTQNKLLIYLFFISFFVGEISVQLAHNYQDILPQAIQNMIWSYTEGEYIQEKVDFYANEPLYARVLRALPRFLLNVFAFTLILKRKHFKSNNEVYPLFAFLLLWLSFCNFTLAIPSFGARFLTLAFPLITYIVLLLYADIKALRWIILLIPIAFSYDILYWVRNMITVTDPYLILSFFPHILIKNLF